MASWKMATSKQKSKADITADFYPHSTRFSTTLEDEGGNCLLYTMKAASNDILRAFICCHMAKEYDNHSQDKQLAVC